jgi:RecB family exonuclease
MRHSASSLETWQNCPRLWKAKYVDKVVPYVEHPAAKRGIEIHEKLENAVKSGHAPADVWTPQGLIAQLHRKGAQAEVKVALDEAGNVVGFSDEKAKIRGVVDVYLAGKGHTIILDWKTGKVRPKKIQADTYTAFAKALCGPDSTVSFRFVYVDQKQVVSLDRDNLATTRIYQLIEQVEQDTEHLPQPGWLCRFCDYYACRYNENPAKYAREKDDGLE